MTRMPYEADVKERLYGSDKVLKEAEENTVQIVSLWLDLSYITYHD